METKFVKIVVIFWGIILLAGRCFAYDPPYPLPYEANDTMYTDFVSGEFTNGDIWQFYFGGTCNLTTIHRNPYNGNDDLNFCGDYYTSRYYTASTQTWGTWTVVNSSFGTNGWYPLTTLIYQGKIHSSLDIVQGGGTTPSYNYTCGDYNENECDVVLSADVARGALPVELTVTLNPQNGGTVESDPSSDFTCSNNPCFGHFIIDEEVELTATPETDYVFEYWDDGALCYYDNPVDISMSGDITLTAKFYKTFRDSAGSFYADIGDVEGQCIVYVRTETEIPWDDMHGDAKDSYQQAIDAGYQTSATVPRISSVIVFDYQEGSIPSEGHVGIVTAINGTNITFRDSNWNGDGKVGVRTKDVSNYNILGYIYHTP